MITERKGSVTAMPWSCKSPQGDEELIGIPAVKLIRCVQRRRSDVKELCLRDSADFCIQDPAATLVRPVLECLQHN